MRNSAATNTNTSGAKSGIIVAVALGCVVLGVCLAVLFMRKRNALSTKAPLDDETDGTVRTIVLNPGGNL